MKFSKFDSVFLPALFGAAALLSNLPADAGENTWTTNGPPGPVQYLAASASDPSTVYAASNPTSLDIPVSIFKSIDGGESWDTLSSGDLTYAQINCLAINPTQPETVFAGMTRWGDGFARGEFLRSSDSGAHWESTPIDPRSYSATSIAVDTRTGSIYLGQYAGEEPSIAPVLKSTDGGSTWSETALAKPNFTYALLADSLNHTLLVGTDFYYASPFGLYGYGGNVARTQDGGATWSVSPTDLGSSVVSLTKNSQGSAYYAGTRDGVLYASSDLGANWARLATLPGTISALAVDPVSPSVLYAATLNRGVLRSRDSGASWRSFNAGMSTRSVTSLTIDSTGRVLHVGTDQGVFDLRIAPVPPETVPCSPADDHLCLFGSRFRIDLTAIDPFTRRPFSAHAVAGDGHSGYFTFPSLIGDPALPEVMVKMVDATSLPGGGHWVFYAGMTSLLYTLTVTDTTTGVSREYSGEESCGGADIGGFLPGGAREVRSDRGALAILPIAPSSDLELLGGRFHITLTARHPKTSAEVPGLAIPLADRFGAFSLPEVTGNADLPEVFVKMIDATGGSFLFFYAGLTSLDDAITVSDTVTGTENTYVSEDADARRPCGAGRLLKFPQ